ncbi:hypothetical protein DFJ73DRAFT_890791, partial [Zopfochytrium polystomum]
EIHRPLRPRRRSNPRSHLPLCDSHPGRPHPARRPGRPRRSSRPHGLPHLVRDHVRRPHSPLRHQKLAKHRLPRARHRAVRRLDPSQRRRRRVVPGQHRQAGHGRERWERGGERTAAAAAAARWSCRHAGCQGRFGRTSQGRVCGWERKRDGHACFEWIFWVLSRFILCKAPSQNSFFFLLVLSQYVPTPTPCPLHCLKVRSAPHPSLGLLLCSSHPLCFSFLSTCGFVWTWRHAGPTSSRLH